MRKIKFRGKAIMPVEELEKIGVAHKDGWVIGNLIVNGDSPLIVGDVVDSGEDYITHEFWVRVDPKTVGQFIGSKDKNDRKIYEGDVVIHEDFSIGCTVDLNLTGQVKLIDGSWVVERGKNGEYLFTETGTNEIIGNIFDNPELLEVTE